MNVSLLTILKNQVDIIFNGGNYLVTLIMRIGYKFSISLYIYLFSLKKKENLDNNFFPACIQLLKRVPRVSSLAPLFITSPKHPKKDFAIEA